MKRALADMLVEVVSGLQPEGAAPLVRVTSVYLDLPVEVGLRSTAGTLELLAELPRWRWRTDFDGEAGRLKVRWAEEGGAL